MLGLDMSSRSAPKSQTLLAVDDVLVSTHWYAELLQLRPLNTTVEDTHGNTYNRLFHGDSLILQLHAWDIENHPNLVGRDKGPPGHGVLIWFEVTDFDDAVNRAHRLKAEVVSEPAINPNSRQHEIWLRDPDGYMVVLSSPGRSS